MYDDTLYGHALVWRLVVTLIAGGRGHLRVWGAMMAPRCTLQLIASLTGS